LSGGVCIFSGALPLGFVPLRLIRHAAGAFMCPTIFSQFFFFFPLSGGTPVPTKNPFEFCTPAFRSGVTLWFVVMSGLVFRLIVSSCVPPFPTITPGLCALRVEANAATPPQTPSTFPRFFFHDKLFRGAADFFLNRLLACERSFRGVLLPIFFRSCVLCPVSPLVLCVIASSFSFPWGSLLPQSLRSGSFCPCSELARFF